MELIQAIALLCQVSTGHSYDRAFKDTAKIQSECQQSYLNCVLKRRSQMPEKEALEKCVLEK